MKDFIGLLEFIGWDANEWMQYGFKYPDGRREWHRQRVPQALNHMRAVMESGPPLDMWYGINPVTSNGSGRAKGSEVTRVVSAYLDLDFKSTGLGSESNALYLLEKLLKALNTECLSIIHTGGGIQVYFPLSEEKSQDVVGAGLLIKKLELVAKEIAHTENLGKIDSVADLSRVFRVPGSRNQKYEDKPEVFRVYGVIACDQEDSVKWVGNSDSNLLTLDPKILET